MHWIMSSRARIRLALVVIVGGLLLGMLLIMKMSGKTSPINTQDYDTVVQLIHEGQLKLSDKEGMVRLPSGYSYLSLNGSISVASSVDTAPTRVVHRRDRHRAIRALVQRAPWLAAWSADVG